MVKTSVALSAHPRNRTTANRDKGYVRHAIKIAT